MVLLKNLSGKRSGLRFLVELLRWLSRLPYPFEQEARGIAMKRCRCGAGIMGLLLPGPCRWETTPGFGAFMMTCHDAARCSVRGASVSRGGC